MDSLDVAARTMTHFDATYDTRGSSSSPASNIVCRKMRDDDIEAAVALLHQGFPERTISYWQSALDRLRVRAVPEGFPRYGYVIADSGRVVGILLLIFSRKGEGAIHANVSSWYVESSYRTYSTALLGAPMRLKDVTLFNISPAPNTLDTIEAQGFSAYAEGTFHALAAAAPRVAGLTIKDITPDAFEASSLLRDHAAWGCISLEVTFEGVIYPFVFAPARCFRDRLICAHIVYCDDVEQFVRFAGPLGRHLMKRGLPWVMIDANGPIHGLVGHYFAGRRRKYYRGTNAPRLGDLSYSELVVFGP